MTPETAFDPRQALLAFEDVHKSYGDFHAVRGVSFHVDPGEVLGLLGPNGAGKSTLIRILMDILRPTSGTAWLFGAPLVRDALDRVGYLPEERGLYTKLKVIDVMVYFGTLKGLSRREARQRAHHWLERVELPDVAKQKVESLSKGMSQKVQIASTLLTEPELCVLDEPFSGLDPVNVQLVKQLIEERRAAGRTTILSTHQMNMVEELCDRVALIHRGELVVYGEVDAVREASTPLEVEVRAAGLPDVHDLPGVLGMTEVSEGVVRLRLDSGGEAPPTPADVLAQLIERGARVDHFERVLARMEDVFIEVVRGSGAAPVLNEDAGGAP